MNDINITSAQYTVNLSGEAIAIKVTIEGVEMFVPLSAGNRHYDEIMRQVEAGTLTIQDAD